MPLRVQPAELVLGFGTALFCRALEPVSSLLEILRHAIALGSLPAHARLVFGIHTVGRRLDPARCVDLVARHTPAPKVQLPNAEFRWEFPFSAARRYRNAASDMSLRTPRPLA